MTPLTPRSGLSGFFSFTKPPLDPGVRRQTYGRIRPMDCDRTWWERLLRR